MNINKLLILITILIICFLFYISTQYQYEHICVLGMGDCGSKTKINVENNVLTIDKQTVNLTNEQINNLIVNTTVSLASSCSGGVINKQELNIKGLTAGEDINLDTNQSISSILDFSCVNESAVKDSTSAEMINSLMAGLQSDTNQESLAKLSAAAKTDNTSGFMSGLLNAPTNSKTNVNLKNNYQAVSDKTKNIVNRVANSLQKNFNQEDIKTCSAKMVNDQKQDIENLKAGRNIKGVFKQDIASKVFTECLNKSGTANIITQNLLSDFNVKVKDTTTQKSVAEMEAKSETKSTSSGPFESIFGDIFSKLGLPIGAGIASSVLSVLCCFAIICLIIYFIFIKKENDK